MPAVLGNIIAAAAVAALVFVSVRSLRRSHKEGGCCGCAGCSGHCASCSHALEIRKTEDAGPRQKQILRRQTGKEKTLSG